MPQCGSQSILCNVPIRIDSYKGCTHNCKYCFSYRKYDIKNIKKDESAKSLRNFINGERNNMTNWCDFDIPLHWGGMSDPFQPCEKHHKVSLGMLEVFAETKYPFIVSTKGDLVLEEPYFSLFKECNCVFQVSAVCPSTSKIESGAPHFNRRMEVIEKMSEIVPRTIVRCQPYIVELHKEISDCIDIISKTGAYGIVYEAIKMQKKVGGMVRLGGDYVYEKSLLENKFMDLRERCHKNGLVFLSGENRLRSMGDSLTCCGCEGLKGFENVNKCNLNYLKLKPEEYKATSLQKSVSTGEVFVCIAQIPGARRLLKTKSFEDCIERVSKLNVYKDLIG